MDILRKIQMPYTFNTLIKQMTVQYTILIILLYCHKISYNENKFTVCEAPLLCDLNS